MKLIKSVWGTQQARRPKLESLTKLLTACITEDVTRKDTFSQRGGLSSHCRGIKKDHTIPPQQQG